MSSSRPPIPPRRRAGHVRDRAAPRTRSGARCSTPGATPPRRPRAPLAQLARERPASAPTPPTAPRQDREDAAAGRARASDPDVADQRLVAAVGGGRLGARLAALLAALGEDEPARARRGGARRARRPRRAPCCAPGPAGTGCRRSSNGGRRVSTRPSRPSAPRLRVGERARDEVARRCPRRSPARRARRRTSCPRSGVALVSSTAQVAGGARLDRAASPRPPALSSPSSR